MTTKLETDELAAPVLPSNLTEVSLPLQQYLRDFDNYIAALRRDLNTLRSKADEHV